MKIWLHKSSMIVCTTYRVDYSLVSFGNNSIRLPAGQKGSSTRRYDVIFPIKSKNGKKLISISDRKSDNSITVDIPDWLISKKRDSGELLKQDDIVQL